MEVLLHKCEFKNIEVEFLKVSEKNLITGLPDIAVRKSWGFLILTVSASTVKCSRVRYRRQLFRPSVNIYVKVSIQINYTTKQPSNFA